MESQHAKSPQELTAQEIRALIFDLQRKQDVLGLKVPVKRTNYYHKKLKQLELMYEPANIQKIINDENDKDYKVILMSSEYNQEKLELNEDQTKEVNVIKKQYTLNYQSYSNQQIFDIFQEKFPIKKPQTKEAIPFPNSFQTAGHLAHYNLTQQQAPYLHVIGEITLMRCPNIKTVVNKTEKLHNVYRTPTLEHMAGQQGRYFVSMKEVGVTFQFDFQKVYWCSRLQQERDRLLKLIKPGECLADLFCGVGPLAVRAAKKGAYVISNDLNPYCHQYLVKNAKLNSVQEQMMCWNMCAREAARRIFSQHDHFSEKFREPDHIYMNLPVDAIEFLDVLRDYGQSMKTAKMPLVHVNCFVVANSDEKSKQLLGERIGKALPGFKADDIITMHHIKNVTVIMRMYCVTFRLKQKYAEAIIPQNQQQQIVDKVQKKKKLQ